MAESRKANDSNGVKFKLKSLLVHALKYTILFTGCFTSATGGFKAIPFLVSIYPLNLLFVPSLLVTILCIISALSGFIATWSGYAESMAELSDYFLNNSPENNTESKTQLNVIKSNLLGRHQQAYADLCRDIEDWHLHSRVRSSHQQVILQTLRNIQKTHDQQLHKCKQSEEIIIVVKNYSYYINLAVKLALQIISLVLLCFGSLVVIGLGISTNLSFVQYAGFPVSALFMSICIVASLFKQLTQLSFSGIRQFQKFCELFGLSSAKTDLNDQFKHSQINVDAEIHVFKSSIEKLLAVKQQLILLYGPNSSLSPDHVVKPTLRTLRAALDLPPASMPMRDNNHRPRYYSHRP